MRTKNRARLLRRAVADVLKQDFQDWTLVVVNDGGLAAEVDAVLAEYKDALRGRAIVLHHPESLGMEAASNRGIAAVDSEFVAVHDDDDEWAPEFLSTTVSHLEQNPEDGGVTVRTEIVHERLTEHGREIVGRFPVEPGLKAITLVDLLQVNRFVPISFLFRRSVFNELGGFDESLKVVGDWEFHLRFAATHRIALLTEDVLAFWNHRLEADGHEANSVIAGQQDHLDYSLLVRDRLLKSHVQQHGLGPLLYERELLHAEMRHLHEHLDRLQDQLGQLSQEIRQFAVPGVSRVRALIGRAKSRRVRG